MMSRKIAFAGIFTGIAVVLIYISTIMPTGKLTLYFLASLPVAFSIIEFGSGAGISIYFAVCILAFLITGNVLGVIPFALFFGHYPIFKYHIEKGRKAMAEILLKLAVFNASALLWYMLFKNLFIETLPIRQIGDGALLIALIAAIQLVFFIYDYVFTRLLFYYETKLDIFKRG